MKSYKNRTKTQKLYNMKGCSNKKRTGKQRGGGCGCSLLSGGRSRRHKKIMAYPAANSASQTAFAKDYLAYTGKQNGGGVINPALPYGPINNYGGARQMRGGGSGKWPDGLTGSAWGAKTSELPGMNGVSGDRNFLQYNKHIPVDPQTQGVINSRAMSGGGKRRGQRGGANFFTQDLVNMGRQVLFGAQSSYNALGGYTAPVNQMPWKGHLADTPNVSNFKYYRL
jgi:hypothetical protein